MNTTKYSAWIHQQLEPTDNIIVGNHKRITPAWVEKNRYIDQLIESIGIEEYRRRVAEDKEREKQDYYY